MADYVKSTNFFAKDALVSGDPNKIIKGSEIDTEFNSLATAISSKADTNSPIFTGLPTAPTAAVNTNTTQLATTAFVKSAVDTSQATAAITGGTITGVTLSGLATDLSVADGGTGKSTLALNNVLLGNGTAAVKEVAPGTAGNLLTSDGTEWKSTAAPNTGIGNGQTWQNLTSTRAVNTNYTNSTGKPIMVVVSLSSTNGGGTGGATTATALVGGVNVAYGLNSDSSGFYQTPISLSFIVPTGAVYRINTTADAGTSVGVSLWSELR